MGTASVLGPTQSHDEQCRRRQRYDDEAKGHTTILRSRPTACARCISRRTSQPITVRPTWRTTDLHEESDNYQNQAVGGLQGRKNDQMNYPCFDQVAMPPQPRRETHPCYTPQRLHFSSDGGTNTHWGSVVATTVPERQNRLHEPSITGNEPRDSQRSIRCDRRGRGWEVATGPDTVVPEIE